MTGGRLIACGALAVAIVAIALVLLGGSPPYKVHLEMENAGQLVRGNLATIGGIGVGKVSSIELTPDAQANVTITVTEGRFTPLHEGTTATVRVSSLSSVANRVIALTPGANSNPELHSGATIPATETKTPVEIDQLVSALDSQTRTALQDLIHGSDRLYSGGKAPAANRSLAALNPAVGETARTLEQLNLDQRAFTGAIVNTAGLMQTLATERTHLDGLLRGAAQLSGSLARRTASIRRILDTAPQGLQQFQEIVDRFRQTFRDLTPQARQLSAVTPLLNETVTRLRPTLTAAGPALADVRPAVGALADVLNRMPALRGAAVPALKAARGALRDAIPILNGAVAYFPDVFYGTVGGFGGLAGGFYDANGSYLRVRPHVGAGNSLQGALGALLNPIVKGTLKFDPNRCPGGAADAAPDGSSPYSPAASPCTNRGPNQ
jgi:phospholipid/cholesterol/gamma-HCH transport system substrate-binding protein